MIKPSVFIKLYKSRVRLSHFRQKNMWKNSLNRHVTQPIFQKIWKVDGTDGSSPVGIPVGKAYDVRILVEKDDRLKYTKRFYKKNSYIYCEIIMDCVPFLNQTLTMMNSGLNESTAWKNLFWMVW